MTASNNNIVRNYFNVDGDRDSGINQDLDLWDGFFDVGEPNRHSQQMQINYDLPLSKIPFLSFINAQYSYTSNFDWQRGGDALNEVVQEVNPGEEVNTVQNANTHNLTANLSMQRFYDYLGLKKRDGKVTASQASARRAKGADGEDEKPIKKTSKTFNTIVDIVTMIKLKMIN